MDKKQSLTGLGQRVKSCRKALTGSGQRGEMSREDLAEKTGYTVDAIRKIENGLTQQPRRISILAKVLDQTPAYLLYGHAELEKLKQRPIDIALIMNDLSAEDIDHIELYALALLAKRAEKSSK